MAQLFDLIDTGLSEPGLAPPQWGTPDGAAPPSASDADTGRDLLPAAVSTHAAPETSTATKELGQRLLTLGKVRRLPVYEVEQLARLAGNIVELDLHIQLDIVGDGRATVSYRHELLNMSARPLTKLAREPWTTSTCPAGASASPATGSPSVSSPATPCWPGLTTGAPPGRTPPTGTS